MSLNLSLPVARSSQLQDILMSLNLSLPVVRSSQLRDILMSLSLSLPVVRSSRQLRDILESVARAIRSSPSRANVRATPPRRVLSMKAWSWCSATSHLWAAYAR